MDTSLNHPSPLILVVGEMHKEARQAAGGLISLGDTSKDGAHPQLSSGHDASADFTAKADSGIYIKPNLLEIVKLEDLSDILKDTRSAFFTPDSLTDEPIIVSDSQKEELEQAKVKAEAEVASMKAKPSYPDINQLTELLVTSLKPELSKLLASHDFASCLPTDMKELPSKITGLSGEIKELKQHIKDIEIELPRDLIEILTKLELFTSTISSLSSQLKALDSLPNLLHKVFDTLNRFYTVMENASGAVSMGVPSACQAPPSPIEGEKNTKDASTNLKNELIDLLGKDVVTQYYTKKLLFDKYYDKMLKRKKNLKITNCEVLTKKCPITLKIYREDGFEEVISNLKISNLHSAEWREVLQACPDKSEKGWKTIYDLVKTRVDQLTQTEQELKIDLNQPLKEQDPLDKLTDLANKKRKITSDLRDHSSLSTSVAEVPSALALQVLRILGSIFTSVYAAVQKLKKDSWLELQFSLADNSKLNVVLVKKVKHLVKAKIQKQGLEVLICT
ncbi:hypothetical protein Tco_0832047 [Tanacetum coccineum]